MKVKLICPGCKNIINTSKAVTKEIADKIYFDALTNPMIGWCEDCNRKPMPELVGGGNK